MGTEGGVQAYGRRRLAGTALGWTTTTVIGREKLRWIRSMSSRALRSAGDLLGLSNPLLTRFIRPRQPQLAGSAASSLTVGTSRSSGCEIDAPTGSGRTGAGGYCGFPWSGQTRSGQTRSG